MRKILKLILVPFTFLYRQWSGGSVNCSSDCNINIGNNNQSTVSINGEVYSGRSVKMVNGKVYVDNVLKNREKTIVGDVSIIVNGDVKSIELGAGCITAKNVTSISTASGSVDCQDVSESISTMSGDVRCNKVHGNISTMSGDVSKRFT